MHVRIKSNACASDVNCSLIKELYIKANGILSLQKHYHRAEHWMVAQGKPKITLNKKNFYKKEDSIHYLDGNLETRLKRFLSYNYGDKFMFTATKRVGNNDVVQVKSKYIFK